MKTDWLVEVLRDIASFTNDQNMIELHNQILTAIETYEITARTRQTASKS